MRFSVMFFASDQSAPGVDKYRLVLESARFADHHGFQSVWVPERHFTALGSLYPNPAVLHAALARETTRLRLCAGSVVLPLHDPIRVAEEWAMVDNLSGGRVGISFASGWNPDDFAFFPDRYQNRSAALYPGIEQVRALWRGQPITIRNGLGKETSVRIYPAPVQPELPFWVTAAGNPRTFEQAGAIGARLLTHLLDQDTEALASKLAIYRAARARAGHDGRGHVTIMVHTYVGQDWTSTIEQARAPYVSYIKANIGLLQALADSRDRQVDTKKLSPAELDAFIHFLYDRFVSQRALIGTPDSCFALVESLARAGVDEVACLLDFGPPVELALANLEHLDRLRVRAEVELPGERELARGTIEIPRDLDLGAGAAAAPAPAAAAAGGEPVGPAPASTAPASLEALRARCVKQQSHDEFYRRIAESGAHYGPTMRTIEGIWLGDGEVLARLRLDPSLGGEQTLYGIHPTLLDNCFLLLATLVPVASAQGGRLIGLPRGVRRFELLGEPCGVVWSHMVLGPPTAEGPTGDVRIFDEDGRVVVEAEGLQVSLVEAPRRAARPIDALLYRMTWQPEPPRPRAQGSGPRGPWLILADRGGCGDALAELLRQRGEVVAVAKPGDAFRAPGRDPGAIRPASPDDAEQLVAGLGNGRAPRQIVHLWSLDVPPGDDPQALAEAELLGLSSALYLAQALVRRGGSELPRLHCVTRGAQTAGQDVDGGVASPAQAALWGLGRVIGAEHPEIWGGLVDLAVGMDPRTAGEALARWLAEASPEDQVLLRRQRYVARLARDEAYAPAAAPQGFDERGTYLVTGGLGDLGLKVAAWMAERGARHLVLMTRRELPAADAPEAAHGPAARRWEAVRAIERLGATVEIAAVDVGDRAQLDAWYEQFRRRSAPALRGVVHLAAVTRGATVMNLTAAALRDVLQPKAAGALHLHARLRDEPLDFFVLFSAVPGLVGWIGAGAGNYAAANAFLDALAHHRRAAGRPAASLDYGPWSEIGMAAREDGALGQLGRVGIGAMTPEQGLGAMDYAMSADLPQLVIASIDWPRFFAAFPRARTSPLLSALVAEDGDTARGAAAAAVRTSLAVLPAGERSQFLEGYLKGHIARVLSVAPARLDPHRSLLTLGLDSLTSIEIKNRIEAELSVTIPIVQLLKGPSISQLAARLLPLIDLTGLPTAPSAEEPFEELVI